MKRIAIITGSDIRYYGGAEKYIIDLSRRLNGYDITVFSYRSRISNRLTDKDAENLVNGSIVYYKPIIAPVSLDRIPITRSALKMLSALKGYDTIINFDLSPAIILIVSMIGKLYKKKVILEVHDPYGIERISENETKMKAALLRFYRMIRTNAILGVNNIRVINRSDYDFLKESSYKGNAHLIPILVELGKPKVVANKKEFVCLYVGRLDKQQKGLDFLERIIEKTVSKNKMIKFHIVGTGDAGSENIVGNLASRYRENVKWLGFAQKGDTVKREYRNATAFIMTSRFEGSPATLAEALANGLVCIAFSVKGVRDVLNKVRESRLIESYDVDSFVDGILELYDKWNSGQITKEFKTRISKKGLKMYDYRNTLLKIRNMIG